MSNKQNLRFFTLELAMRYMYMYMHVSVSKVIYLIKHTCTWKVLKVVFLVLLRVSIDASAHSRKWLLEAQEPSHIWAFQYLSLMVTIYYEMPAHVHLSSYFYTATKCEVGTRFHSRH